MQIQLKLRNISLDVQTRGLIRRKVFWALDHIEQHVQYAQIRVEDINGPSKGGVDKRCKIEVHLYDGETLFAEAIATQVLDAVDDSLHRVIQSARKYLDRGLRVRRSGLWIRHLDVTDEEPLATVANDAR